MRDWLIGGLILAGLLFAGYARADMVAEIERAEAIMSAPWTLTPADIAIITPVGAVAYRDYGKASWYPRTGNRTANGEKYPTAEMTCAHRTLPFGTRVDVTRVDNGRSIRCRINDRGPFISGRVIDLNPRAALGLGIVKAGVVKVRVEVIAP